jgi:hypothetical protein
VAASATGGADTFVFGSTDGLDHILDFDATEFDKIDLDATKLKWKDLDTNGNDVLDNGDDYVSISSGDTKIDLGAATGDSAALQNVVTVDNVTGLVEDDFIF